MPMCTASSPLILTPSLLLLLSTAADAPQVVGEASLAMQAANIPHNVLIADCGSRVFIWPQAYAERQAKGLVPEELLDCGVNPAVWEISGHMVLKRAQVRPAAGYGGEGGVALPVWEIISGYMVLDCTWVERRVEGVAVWVGSGWIQHWGGAGARGAAGLRGQPCCVGGQWPHGAQARTGERGVEACWRGG
jgi:hypothetical protein